jgi:hypothetical protein
MEDPGIDEKITLEWILKKEGEGVVCIYMAQDRDQWRTLVNVVMDNRIP